MLHTRRRRSTSDGTTLDMCAVHGPLPLLLRTSHATLSRVCPEAAPPEALNAKASVISDLGFPPPYQVLSSIQAPQHFPGSTSSLQIPPWPGCAETTAERGGKQGSGQAGTHPSGAGGLGAWLWLALPVPASRCSSKPSGSTPSHSRLRLLVLTPSNQNVRSPLRWQECGGYDPGIKL